jgi:hypothetical protein
MASFWERLLRGERSVCSALWQEQCSPSWLLSVRILNWFCQLIEFKKNLEMFWESGEINSCIELESFSDLLELRWLDPVSWLNWDGWNQWVVWIEMVGSSELFELRCRAYCDRRACSMLLESKSTFWSSEYTATMQTCSELESFSDLLELRWLDPVSWLNWDGWIQWVDLAEIELAIGVLKSGWAESTRHLCRDAESLLR